MKRRTFIAGLGSVAAWPVMAWGQQRTVPVIGYLSGAASTGSTDYLSAFREGLREEGYVEGKNAEILYRWADARYENLPGLAADMVGRGVSVIFAVAPNAVFAAKSVTSTIPIIFQLGADPVALGFVASLNHPGANITGITFLTTALIAKRLELLHQMMPSVQSIGFLVNPFAPPVVAEIKEAETAAKSFGLHLEVAKATTPGEIETALGYLRERGVGGLLIGADPLFYVQNAPLFARSSLPAIWNTREMVDAGGLLSYGASFKDSQRLCGNYVGRILKGKKPADLPVQQSTRIEMIINRKATKALGIEIPTSILLRADEVIE